MKKELNLNYMQVDKIVETLEFLKGTIYKDGTFDIFPMNDVIEKIKSFGEDVQKFVERVLKASFRPDWESMKSQLPKLWGGRRFYRHEEKYFFNILWNLDPFLDAQIYSFCSRGLFDSNYPAQNLIKNCLKRRDEEPTEEEVESVYKIEDHPRYIDRRSKRKIIKIVKKEIQDQIEKMKELYSRVSSL